MRAVSSLLKPDLVKALQVAARTGQVVYGTRRVAKLLLHGKAKLVVMAANTPPEVKRDLVYYAKLSKIPVVIFEGTNMELGTIIGRPHSVAALAIIEPGQSNILELAREAETSE